MKNRRIKAWAMFTESGEIIPESINLISAEQCAKKYDWESSKEKTRDFIIKPIIIAWDK